MKAVSMVESQVDRTVFDVGNGMQQDDLPSLRSQFFTFWYLQRRHHVAKSSVARCGENERFKSLFKLDLTYFVSCIKRPERLKLF